MEQCSVREAAQKLQERFPITAIPEAGEPATELDRAESGGEATAKNEPLKFRLKGIDHGHPYLGGRGISKETAEKFGVGFFAGRGSMHGRIVIPIHDENGQLLAYAGRSIDDSEPKYKLPNGFHKSLVLYNLHRSRESIGPKAPIIVLVEGFFDCIKVYEAGYPCVALMGSSLSLEQEELISVYFNRAVLLLDGDEPGQLATDECLRRLGRKLWVKAIGLAAGNQPDELTEDKLAVLLAQN
jgi:DNA primase